MHKDGAARIGFRYALVLLRRFSSPDWAARDRRRMRGTSRVLTLGISLRQSRVYGCGFACPPETSLLGFT